MPAAECYMKGITHTVLLPLLLTGAALAAASGPSTPPR